MAKTTNGKKTAKATRKVSSLAARSRKGAGVTGGSLSTYVSKVQGEKQGSFKGAVG